MYSIGGGFNDSNTSDIVLMKSRADMNPIPIQRN